MCGLYSVRLQRLDRLFSNDGSFQITSLRFNHNGNIIATGSNDGVVRVYDINVGASILSFPAHKSFISSIIFSNDETSLFTGGADGAVNFVASFFLMSKVAEWNISSGRLIHSHNIDGFQSNAQELAVDMSFSSNGEFFATTSKSKDFLLYRVPFVNEALLTSKVRSSSSSVQRICGHDGAITSVHCWPPSCSYPSNFSRASCVWNVVVSVCGQHSAALEARIQQGKRVALSDKLFCNSERYETRNLQIFTQTL